jgi:hypothetical protein
MASFGFDIVLTGLMLICLDGQPSCPKGPYATDKYPNTAWVVRADGKSMPCGRESPETTRLELIYDPKELYPVDESKVHCEPERLGRRACVLVDSLVTLSDQEICVTPSSGALTRNDLVDKELRGLPHLDEVDRRFKALRMERLKAPYVPTRIYFPGGLIDTGPKWPDASLTRTTLWYRSNGNAGGDLPRDLSDRLKASYGALVPINLDVTFCGTNQRLIELKQKEATATVVLRNVTKEDYAKIDQVGQFDDIGYLVWYYSLGLWDTPFGGTCPDYALKDTVLLRCVRDSATGCAYRPNLPSDTRFWPPMVKP